MHEETTEDRKWRRFCEFWVLINAPTQEHLSTREEVKVMVEDTSYSRREPRKKIKTESRDDVLACLSVLFNLNMALPQSLRVSVTPPELELISCQQLVEIVPLISMEKTAFISVNTTLIVHHA